MGKRSIRARRRGASRRVVGADRFVVPAGIDQIPGQDAPGVDALQKAQLADIGQRRRVTSMAFAGSS
jgi:hypothetical protein